MAMLKLVLTIAVMSAVAYGSVRDEDDFPTTHLVMLQFNLDGDDPYEFAAYAPDFAETLEKILRKSYEFDSVNAIVLGVGKTDCGISVVTVIEYTKNQTDHLSLSEIVQFIIDTIDDNKYLFEDMYGVKNVRSVDTKAEHVKYVAKEDDNSTATVIGAVVGCLCLVGVAAAVAVGAAIYLVKRRKKYQKVPLLVDESLPSEKSWLKLPGALKQSNQQTEKF